MSAREKLRLTAAAALEHSDAPWYSAGDLAPILGAEFLVGSTKEDADFIAEASPTTVLALLDSNATLVEALEAMLGDDDPDLPPSRAVHKARAALALARGES